METKYKIMFGLMLVFALVGLSTAAINNNGDGTITLSWTVSIATAVEMKDAICHNYNYQDTLWGYNETTGEEYEYANPQSCQDFTNDVIKEFIKNNIVAYRHYQAQEEARNTVNAMDEPVVT